MKRIIWMVAALLMAGCAQSSIEELSAVRPQDHLPKEYWAYFEDNEEEDSRTYLDERVRLLWTKDDRLTVFKGTTYAREFAFSGRTGANAGGFKQVSTDDEYWFGYDLLAAYALYPYDEEAWFHEEDMYISTMMPAEQVYVENSFGVGANTMVAVTSGLSDNRFVFKNVGSYLRVLLWGDEQTVSSITLSSIAGEPLAGEAKIYASHTNAPTCFIEGDDSSITLCCDTPVEVNTTEDAPVAFWIVVPPVTLAEGYKVTVESASGNTQEFEVNKEKTFKRNVYNTLKRQLAIDVPRNQIWYTSSDGNIVEPNDASVFGVELIDNYYDQDLGRGVMVFDGALTTIGDLAFWGCTKLASVMLPEGVTTLGKQAFSFCYALTSISLPNSISELGYFGFAYSSALSSVVIPEGVTQLYGTFEFCEALSSVSLPNSLEVIGLNAFWGCSNLSTIALPEHVTTIGARAFRECTSLTEVILPGNLEVIGEEAFSYCTTLTSITIPEGIKTIDAYTFYGCTSLADITLPDNLEAIGKGAFYECTTLTSITIPKGVKTIDEFAFAMNDNLVSVYCPSPTPPEVGYHAFDSANVTIYVPAESYWLYMYYYFDGYGYNIHSYNFELNESIQGVECIYYTSSNGKIVQPNPDRFDAMIVSNTYQDGKGVIVFDRAISTIGGEAFWNCTGLTSITLPETVTSIGHGAFSGCTSLSQFSGAFASSDGRCLIVDGLLNSFAPAGLTSYVISESVTSIGDGVFRNCTGLTSITLPESIRSIGDHAFADCMGLTSITLPESIRSIGAYAFTSCMGLTSITLPEGVTSIGAAAFLGCTGLTSITLPESVTSIGDGAFSDCTSLSQFSGAFASSDGRCLIVDGVLISFTPAGLTSYVIPDSITSIGDYAFVGCMGLTSITIPESVTSIGWNAFGGTGLTSITLPESVTSIGDYAFYGCTSLTSVCCQRPIPPTGSNSMFDYNAADRKIYVPASSDSSIINAYKAADGWREYAADMEEMPMPNNLIVYTATSKVIPYNPTVGATMTSNDWDSITGIGFITFDGDVTSIDWCAFERCMSLTSITIPESVTRIGDYAFRNCTGLTSITLPESVTWIGDYAFRNCTGLTSITLPESVTSIGAYAFAGCTSLTSVYCQSTTPPTGGLEMFGDNAPDRKIYVPASDDDSILKAYQEAAYWSDYASAMEEYVFE